MKEERNVSIKNKLGAGIFVFLLVCLDQWTKYLAVLHLKGASPIVIIEQVFELFYLENRGAAFGIFQNQRWIFLILTTLTMFGLIWFYRRIPVKKRYLPFRICVIASFAGAVGNMIDRIKNGYVVDFLYFKLIDFPIFNVADIFVTVAAFLLFLLLCFYYKEEELERILHSGK